ncbi:hypothetical protein BDW68DRAFT_192404 [Aspergillus falconensis]
MAEPSPTKLLGCLLDVSESMCDALDSGHGDTRATERFRAVLSTALQLARAEYRYDPHTSMFIGVFGLNCTSNGGPPSVDLCAVVDELLSSYRDANDQTGHERLVALANQENLAHVAQYIRTKLTEHQARLVHAHLQRHPESIKDFVDAIPTSEELQNTRSTIRNVGGGSGALIGGLGGAVVLGPLGCAFGVAMGICAGAPVSSYGADIAMDYAVEKSDALQLARRICSEWLLDFADFVPLPVAEVVRLLEQLQQPLAAGTEPASSSAFEVLRPYMYGMTPMRDALYRSIAVFGKHTSAEQRTLLLISDGHSTDGDPLPIANDLKSNNVTMATVYLTDDAGVETHRLYDRAMKGWNRGQLKLFDMATRVSGGSHPIPVLASMQWTVPFSGECALYVHVCSAKMLNQFCELLLSARFGSADALLDVVGRVQLDRYIKRKYGGQCRQPSNQGDDGSCYAHAIAAVLHMALRRIRGREHGYPKMEDIRNGILTKFPSKPHGQNTKMVLTEAISWYPPLQFDEVDEKGARQAVLRRRPVLATFRLSESGWTAFCKHFEATVPTHKTVLTRAHMAAYRSLPDAGGHAVLLTRCDPHSLTFLNSWGRKWGDNGSFTIEDPSVLELDDPAGLAKMRFYDVYWQLGGLTEVERKRYSDYVDRMLQRFAGRHPILLELEMACPLCKRSAPIADFTGSLPGAGYLAQALYARAGLGDGES